MLSFLIWLILFKKGLTLRPLRRGRATSDPREMVGNLNNANLHWDLSYTKNTKRYDRNKSYLYK